MSSLPTLLRRGYIVLDKDASNLDKKAAENSISIDYIINKLSNMIPEPNTNYIRSPPKTYGDKVIVLKSDTGSGKSTVLPPKLYTKLFNRTNRNIMVTQPRILTAMDIPETIVPWNKELKMDINIGYSTGPFKRLPAEKGIIFSTVGVLTQELKLNTDEDFIKKYQFIIIDEVHERSIEVDECLYLIKKFMINNYKDPFCPILILMSATFDENVFINYFDVRRSNYIQVIGSTFPIETTYTNYSIANYIEWASLKAQELHINNFADLGNVSSEFRDILIFVKDSTIGKKICDKLHMFNSNILDSNLDTLKAYNTELVTSIEGLVKSPNTLKSGGGYTKKFVLPILLDSQTFTKGGLEYQNLFSSLDIIQVPLWKVTKSNETNDSNETNNTLSIDFTSIPQQYVTPSRRIIVATNLAETGVTIPTLKYCIDTGYVLSAEFFPEYGCQALISKNISLGSAIQRRGRVGRKAPGFFYPCYTEETFNALPVEKISDIITNDITTTILSILIRDKKTDLIQESSINRIKNNKNETIFQTSTHFSKDWYTIKNELSTNLAALDFIEPPSIQALSYAVEKLHILGFIDDNYDITATGFYANKIRFIGLDLSKFILSGYFYKANILDLVTISAFVYITKRNIFEKTFKFDDLKLDIYDDFIMCVFIWNKMQSYITSAIEKSTSKVPTELIEDWCKKNDIKFTGIMKVISMRDSIIENLLEIGINPYYNGLNIQDYNINSILKTSKDDARSEIKKIKCCIYDGFKCNVLKHEQFSMYKSVVKSVPIKVKSQAIADFVSKSSDAHPKYIVCDSYSITGKFGSAQYEFAASGFVSVLDDFVDPDLSFYV
jgi:HrpA-like RNA helicase